jgi:hypothetical protein
LLAGSQFALVRGRPGISGALLGASLLLKPLAWPWLLVLLRRRAWGTLGAAVGTTTLGYSLVVLRQGPQRVLDYFLQVGPALNAGFVHEPTNLSLWTLGARLAADHPLAATAVSAAAGVLVIALVWHCASPRRSLGFSLGVATLAAIVTSPLTWEFYLVLVLLPAACMLGALHTRANQPLAVILLVTAVASYAQLWLPSPAPSVTPLWPVVPYVRALLPALVVLVLCLAIAQRSGVVSAVQRGGFWMPSRPKTWSQRLQ